MRRRTAHTITTLVGVLVLGACRAPQSDPFVDLSAADATVATVGAGTPSTTVSPIAAPPTTTPTETTVTSGSVPLPPTTAAGDGALDTTAEELATTAFGETVAASVTCLADPASCDPAAVTLPGGPAHERFARLVAVFHERGYVVRRYDDVSHWTVESASIGSSPDEVSAVVCDVDGDEVVEPAAHNGLGMDLVVNDEVVARRVRVELRLTPSGWRRWSVEHLGEWPMEQRCAPE